MVEYKKCKLNDIIADAKLNNRVAELKAISQETNEKGERIGFLQVKRNYYLKFYNDMVPQSRGKSMWAAIDEL